MMALGNSQVKCNKQFGYDHILQCSQPQKTNGGLYLRLYCRLSCPSVVPEREAWICYKRVVVSLDVLWDPEVAWEPARGAAESLLKFHACNLPLP